MASAKVIKKNDFATKANFRMWVHFAEHGRPTAPEGKFHWPESKGGLDAPLAELHSNPRLGTDPGFWERSRLVNDVLAQLGRRAEEINIVRKEKKMMKKKEAEKQQAKDDL